MSDLALASGFCALALLQVLVDPIAGPAASVLVALGATLPLAWRRTHPSGAALAGSVVWLVPTQGYLYLGFVVAALLYFSVGTGVPDLRRTLWVIGVGVTIGVVAVLSSDQHPSTAVAITLAVVGPAAVGRLVAHQRSQTAHLQELTDRLRGERATSERAAVAEERSRIARELHDVIGHEVTVIALQADAAAAALEKAPERAAAPVAAIRQSASDALTEMRRVLDALRTEPVERDLRPQPGLADLTALVDRSRSAGTAVELTVELPSRTAPASVQLAAYRLVQEGLTNVRRHASGASVQVRVDGDADAITVAVLDSGGRPGGPTAGDGLGLVGMRERVRMLGGELRTGPVAGGGFAISARLPLDAPGSA